MNFLRSLRKTKVRAVIELSLVAALILIYLLSLALRSPMPSSTVLGVRWVASAHVPSTEVINGKTFHVESASAACSTSVQDGFGGGPVPKWRCLAERLAWDPRPGANAYVWVVALDPPGGKYLVSTGSGGSPFLPDSFASDYNYAVDMIDVYTGKYVDAEAGYDPAVPSFPN